MESIYPKGFHSFGRNIGIKDSSLDFAVIYSEKICNAAAVFTRNNFPGSPVIVGREHIKDGKLQAIVINSKNSNVATGETGILHAKQTCEVLAEALKISPLDILPSSTGVIGVPLPIEKIIQGCRESINYLKPGNLEQVAEAIMTTDTKKKISFRKHKNGVVYGIAKGAGMIEPNMATMLCYIVTDLKILGDVSMYEILKSSVDKSFNCMSIDSDTSTSDTVVLMSNGLAGEIPVQEFQPVLDEICIDLAKAIAKDGEGATKLIEVDIINARDDAQATKIGKSIINSPLIKTAIYGADPNWGRFIMAIGKVFDEKIDYNKLSLQIGNVEVKNASFETKEILSKYLKSNKEISITVNLNEGSFNKRFWGCDLTEGYVKENAYYTT